MSKNKAGGSMNIPKKFVIYARESLSLSLCKYRAIQRFAEQKEAYFSEKLT